jgi:hypothetical protein
MSAPEGNRYSGYTPLKENRYLMQRGYKCANA